MEPFGWVRTPVEASTILGNGPNETGFIAAPDRETQW
jgi:hypothetical protein